ncbi:hypothetical protein [Alkalimarinus sediminis]|uniref:Cytoplasmic protein n=1 Tax=Alkalimarinus sediminis TaxID=1632866 RepID=A0A9E8HSY9_9ALTE|nr:hypothetical protein [Alkalimarinus sediminis]UZW75194.1 hypothetical protein NNL22_00885 [Alkalimarinus sediminis]
MSNDQLPEIKLDTENLYREEMFTDHKVGTLRKMTPVTVAGEVDSSREVLFVGQAQMMTPAGALPLNFEIAATSLAEALEKFGTEAQACLERTLEELREMQRQQASSIVVPGQGGGMGGMGGGGIQLP